MVLTPASSAGATSTTITRAAETEDRGSAEEDGYEGTSSEEDDELTPDLTIAAPPSGNKSSPFYGLITYVFQRMAAALPTTVPSGISALHREMYVAALEELRRPGPVVHKKDALVILSTIVNTVVPGGRHFSISKH
ncbi:hypothetical protein BGZ97_008905, partial [Linnemannia gamsii]